MRRALLASASAALAAFLLLALLQARVGRAGVADAAFLPLVFFTLAADLALPALLWTRARALTAPLAFAVGGALVGVLLYALLVLGPGDPMTAPFELGLVVALFAAPALSAGLAARGHRPAAVAAASVALVGILAVYAAAVRFGAFSWGHPLTQALHAAMVGFVAAAGLAVAAVLRPT